MPKKYEANKKRSIVSTHNYEYDHDLNQENDLEYNRKHKNDKNRDDGHICACGDSETGCSCDKKEEYGELNNVMLIRIGASAVLLLAGIFVPVPQLYKIIIFALSFLIVGYDILITSAKNILKGRFFDENLLMTIAAICAFAVGQYPEGTAVILLFRVGELLEEHALGSSRKSIRGLVELKPERAILLKDDAEISVPAGNVNVGDTIILRPGERIPLDGVLLEGRTTLDTSAITGESMPRAVNSGDAVHSGCINIGGMVRMRVTATLEKSTVSRILELVESANAKKAPPEKFITRFARYYTPAVLIAAFIAFIVLTFVMKLNPMMSLRRALIFLVVSCPCALVISVPLTYFAGIGGAAKKGVLFKSSSTMDDMSRVSTIVFDKTGTLTTGRFSVTSVESAYVNRDMLLMLTAYAEYYSNHPLAQSVVSAFGGKVDTRRISNFREKSGKGVSAQVSKLNIIAGTADYLSSEGIELSSRDSGESTIYVAANGKYMGRIMMNDNLKRDAVRAVDTLRQLGADRIVMMTGDRNRSAMKAAVSLGIKEVYAEYLPADKAVKLGEIMAEQSMGKKTIFVGDGINDTPVLATADIGISMGGMGSDAAIEASDVVIMNDEPTKIALAIKIAKETKNIVRQNVLISLGFKAAVMLLGLYGYVPMWLAVFADVGVAILAIFNAMRAYELKYFTKII